MKENEEIRCRNEALYQAVVNSNLAEMDQVWAAETPLLCIHPGGPALTQRDEIMASWQSILGHDTSPRIVHQVNQLIPYDGIVLVTCHEWDEQQDTHMLLATNGFVKENGRYCMVLHQAGPTAAGPDTDVENPEKVVQLVCSHANTN